MILGNFFDEFAKFCCINATVMIYLQYEAIFEVNMEIKDKIKNRRLELGLTLEEVGLAVGVAKSTVKKWESGQIASMRQSKITALAKVLKVDPTYLLFNYENAEISKGDIFKLDNVFPVSTQKIPFLGSVACGEPIYAEEDKESYIQLGTNVNADFCLKAKGDSMIGARIHDGDLVFVRKQEMVDNGEVAVVLIGDEATLKRLFYYPESQKLVLQAENPKYAPFVYVGEELNQIRILGKAVAFQSDVR